MLLLLLGTSTLLGILTDKQEDAKQYYMEAGNVGIELSVDTGYDDAILIQPNAVTPLNIGVTNVDSKDCHVGKVEAMHKASRVESDELIVQSLADDGASTVTASTYMGKEILSIPQVGGWIRKVLDYKWIMIVAAAGLIIIGYMPKGKKEEPRKQRLEHKPLARRAESRARVGNGAAKRGGGESEGGTS